MNIYLVNNSYHYELENLTRVFFPNEKLNVIREFSEPEAPYIIVVEGADELLVNLRIGAYRNERISPLSGGAGDNELLACTLLYEELRAVTGYTPPWGMLTGVRPIKLLRSLIAAHGREEALRRFGSYHVSAEKAALADRTEQKESKIIALSRPESFSLYVGVPFCPSRCAYCSFVMSSVERAQRLMEPFTELLCRELRETAAIVNSLGLRLETVYFGGGTPTTLSPDQLNRVLGTVNECFDLSTCREFTVEAGRPDTITAKKLISLKENNVGRISINPQTVSDEVLAAIGRRHTAEDFFRAFELAREYGFDNINTDLIAGLPKDTLPGFMRSVDSMLALGAENITVHTLCMKRASHLTQDGKTLDRDEALLAAQMVRYARDAMTERGYEPYYLYRQTRMVGNLENVGWSLPGMGSLYNVFVMDETHTILACGAGGVTKLRRQGTDYLKRVFNFKYPYEYVNRFEEMLTRKREILRFYQQESVDSSNV